MLFYFVFCEFFIVVGEFENLILRYESPSIFIAKFKKYYFLLRISFGQKFFIYLIIRLLKSEIVIAFCWPNRCVLHFCPNNLTFFERNYVFRVNMNFFRFFLFGNFSFNCFNLGHFNIFFLTCHIINHLINLLIIYSFIIILITLQKLFIFLEFGSFPIRQFFMRFKQ